MCLETLRKRVRQAEADSGARVLSSEEREEIRELRNWSRSSTSAAAAWLSPLDRSDANRFFRLVNRRYTRGSMIVTSNKSVGEWAELFGEEALAAAILDRLLHDAINGPSYRLRGRR